MNNTNPHLLLFTIGPVQSFISQARKTQDLYAGSKILTHLMKTAVNAIGRDKIIFPFSFPNDEGEWKSVNSLPNRLVALIDDKELKKEGERIEKIVKDEWIKLANTAFFRKILESENCSLNTSHYKQQIERHLEVYWLFQPLDENKYKESYQILERKLGGIKNIRTFEQYNYKQLGEKGRKCGLDGYRNIKFYRKSSSQKELSNSDVQKGFLYTDDNCIFSYKETGNDDSVSFSILQPGEGLSAVSFFKRCYGNKETFESTSEIALLDWIKCFDDREELKNYKNLFKGSNFNTQLLFEDNLNKDYFEKQDIIPKKGRSASDIKRELNKLIDITKTESIKQSKYYAVIVFDGDSMGQWISEAPSVKAHRDFSRLLMDFAKKTAEYIDKGKGRTVYAGGDDFMGLVNLEYLFETLVWIRNEFKKDVTNNVPFKNPNVEAFTLSAGVCIAHYKEPLRLVLGKAKEMEGVAKDQVGKNAFCITVVKGSGQEHKTVWSFENNTIENIQTVINLLKDETFSNSFINNFQREFERLLDNEGNIPPKFLRIMKTELARLLYRSCNLSNKNERKEKSQEIAALIINDLWSINRNVGNFNSLLSICDFMKRTLNSSKQKSKQYV